HLQNKWVLKLQDPGFGTRRYSDDAYYQPAVPLLSVSFILLLAGELIGRGVFYGLHMTVGMAVAS
ncbi:DmsC/YnfH family molybdoenzyme membrane anchor subunit, partial [Escherichia coli]